MSDHRTRKFFCLAAVACAILFTVSAYSGANVLSEADEPSGGYYMTDEPIFQVPEEETSADRRTAGNYPPDPTSDIEWSSGMPDVLDIRQCYTSTDTVQIMVAGQNILIFFHL